MLYHEISNNGSVIDDGVLHRRIAAKAAIDWPQIERDGGGLLPDAWLLGIICRARGASETLGQMDREVIGEGDGEQLLGALAIKGCEQMLCKGVEVRRVVCV